MMSQYNKAISASSDTAITPFIAILAVLVGLGMAFQVGHFLEHAVQFAVWLFGKWQWVIATFCGRDMPFMSSPVTELVRLGGAYLFPEFSTARQMMMGVEILHLIGNTSFLISIAGMYLLIPSKWVSWAFYIEGLHLCEHIALTVTAYYFGKPIGLSTAFGQAQLWWGTEAAVGYRVTWHFVMNLLPLPFVMYSMMKHWRGTRIPVKA